MARKSYDEYLSELEERKRKRKAKIKRAPGLGLGETAKSLVESIKDIPKKTKEYWGDKALGWMGKKKKVVEPEKKEKKSELTVSSDFRFYKPKKKEVKPEAKKAGKKEDPWVKAGKQWMTMGSKIKKRAKLGAK